MRCEEVREHLVAHLDGELPLEESGLIDLHIESCADCRAERDDLGSTGDLLKLLAGGPKSDLDIAGTVLSAARERNPWCRHIRRGVVAFLDGELTEKDSRPIAEHLAECENCAKDAAGLDRTGAALALWPVPEFRVNLVSRVFAKAGIRRPGRSRKFFRFAAAAACILLAFGVFQLLSPGGDDPPHDVLLLMDILDGDTLTLLGEDPELIEMADQGDRLDWLESIPEEELAMLSGSGG